jgi:putative membrane protein
MCGGKEVDMRGKRWAGLTGGVLAASLVVAPVLGGSAPAFGQTAATETAPTGLGGADQEVVMELHHANQKEISAARMAQERASSAAVKDYAVNLVEEHSAADDKLVALARRKGMSEEKLRRPYDALPHGTLAMAKMRALSGPAFDREFTTRMVSNHQKTIDQVRVSRGLVKDPELRALLDELLPKLQRHHERAHALVPKDNVRAAEAANVPAGDRPGMGDSAPAAAPVMPAPIPTTTPAPIPTTPAR